MPHRMRRTIVLPTGRSPGTLRQGAQRRRKEDWNPQKEKLTVYAIMQNQLLETAEFGRGEGWHQSAWPALTARPLL